MSKTIAKKLAMLSLVATMSLSMVACGNTTDTSTKTASFTPGEYTAKSAGKNGDVEIKVTFDETSITSIEVLSSSETAGLGDTAIERLSKAIIDGQTLAVDAVTGATASSNALLAAVEDCVKQAGGNIEQLKTAKEVAETAKEAEEYTTDIVIVGAGAAGMTAGISASANGAKVMIIEKGTSAAVANGANAGGPIAVGTQIQAAEGEDLTMETLFTHMNEFTNNTINSALLRNTLEVTGETLDMMTDLGMDIYLRQDAYGVGFRARHGIREKGQDRMQFLEDEITKNGGEFLFETAGEKIILDDKGNAVGIEAVKADGTKVIIHADAVLIATGGYLGSEEVIADKFGNITVNPLGNTLSVGDGINMVVEAGGVEDNNWGIVANEFSAANSKAGAWNRDCNQNLRFGIYGGLIVNGNGNRFFNEQIMADEPLSGAQSALREGKYYAVMDDAYYQSVATKGIFETLGSPESWVAGVRNLSAEAPESKSHVKVLTEAPAQLQEAIDQGWAFKADTIEELAAHFGLESLADTVASYNAMCEAGKDTDFFKDAAFLTPVNQGPFYVFEYETSAWCTLGGVKVDEYLRALNKDNEPINGLYVAGIDAGSLFTSTYYDNEGSAFGLSLGSGTLAGRNMASYVAATK